jgi:hypothetical protein
MATKVYLPWYWVAGEFEQSMEGYADVTSAVTLVTCLAWDRVSFFAF